MTPRQVKLATASTCSPSPIGGRKSLREYFRFLSVHYQPDGRNLGSKYFQGRLLQLHELREEDDIIGVVEVSVVYDS